MRTAVISGKRLGFCRRAHGPLPKCLRPTASKSSSPRKRQSKLRVHPSSRHSRESGNPVTFVKKTLGSRFRGNDEHLTGCLTVSFLFTGYRRFNTSHSPVCAETE